MIENDIGFQTLIYQNRREDSSTSFETRVLMKHFTRGH